MTDAGAGAPVPSAGPPRRPALWLLVIITMSGTLAMHMFIPALPDVARDLGAGIPAVQATISLYILGLAVGQLVYGPLSDGFGRRPVLMVGLALYAAAGLAAAVAPGIQSLVAARLMQALGGCAGLVLARAMVRDTSESEDAVRRLSLLSLIVAVGPAMAPVVGATLSAGIGWRAIFLLLAGLGVASLLFSWRLLPETGRPTGQVAVGALARGYGALLRAPVFVAYVIGGSCATMSMYAFVATAPFIFMGELHRPPQELGIYLGVLVAGASLGMALAGRLVGITGIERLMTGASALSLSAALFYLTVVLLGQQTVALSLVPFFLYAVGTGAVSPAAVAKSVSVVPGLVGTAAGLFGFTQFAVGALSTTLAGLGGRPSLATACVLVCAGILAQAAFWTARRWERRLLAAAPPVRG